MDDKTRRISRAFQGAAHRMANASTVEDMEDEASNMLHHLYRLGELAQRRDATTSTKQIAGDVAGFLGACWIRTYDTHEATALTKLSDQFGAYFTHLHGTLAFRPLADFTHKKDSDGRWRDYEQNLSGHVVLDSLTQAFDEMVAKVPQAETKSLDGETDEPR